MDWRRLHHIGAKDLDDGMVVRIGRILELNYAFDSLIFWRPSQSLQGGFVTRTIVVGFQNTLATILPYLKATW